MKTIPTSLYIHFPWCAKKCPYCDFNSYAAPKNFPEKEYINALIYDLQSDLNKFPAKELHSIFLGGGTPSLFSASAINKLLCEINKLINFMQDLEITMEINPGTCDQQKLIDLRAAGINRLSIGVQSFAPDKLKILGRIHNKDDAINLINQAHHAKFKNINLDLIHGLPTQTCQDVLDDLQTALKLQPTHLSCYQLTIEKNTCFGRNPPVLPDEENILLMQQQINEILANAGFNKYEISNYCRSDYECQHNLNYWQFGDYLAIGAGAHGKFTDGKNIIRYIKNLDPNDYMSSSRAEKPSSRGLTAGSSCRYHSERIEKSQLPLEFMLNALRLINGVPKELFTQRTGLKLETIQNQLNQAIDQGFIEDNPQQIKPTPRGLQFLNQCLEIFV